MGGVEGGMGVGRVKDIPGGGGLLLLLQAVLRVPQGLHHEPDRQTGKTAGREGHKIPNTITPGKSCHCH